MQALEQLVIQTLNEAYKVAPDLHGRIKLIGTACFM